MAGNSKGFPSVRPMPASATQIGIIGRHDCARHVAPAGGNSGQAVLVAGRRHKSRTDIEGSAFRTHPRYGRSGTEPVVTSSVPALNS